VADVQAIAPTATEPAADRAPDSLATGTPEPLRADKEVGDRGDLSGRPAKADIEGRSAVDAQSAHSPKHLRRLQSAHHQPGRPQRMLDCGHLLGRAFSL